MKKTILLILFPVLILVVLLQLNALPIVQVKTTEESVEANSFHNAPEVTSANLDKSFVNSTSAATRSHGEEPEATVYEESGDKRSDIVNYAITLIGSPYLYAGNTKEGFDCSGFSTHVFDQNGISIKRSSGLQSTEGIAVDRSEAAPGDLVIFTGTDKSVREPGHVGIVISEPGDTIEFIHASSSRSDGGVKISQVEGSGYEARFLEVRRVL